MSVAIKKTEKDEEFRVETENGPAGSSMLSVRMIGRINEDADFAQLLTQIKTAGAKRLEFDLGRVSDINSCGVRDWILFIERLQATTEVTFIRVSEVFIDQVNLVPNMLGRPGTRVVSFDGPYFCSKCRVRVVKQLKSDEVRGSGGEFVAPKFSCPHCSTDLEFDSHELDYFSFLKRFQKS